MVPPGCTQDQGLRSFARAAMSWNRSMKTGFTMQGIAGKSASIATCPTAPRLTTWPARGWKACGMRMYFIPEGSRKPFVSPKGGKNSSEKTASAATRSWYRESMRTETAGFVIAVCLTGQPERCKPCNGRRFGQNGQYALVRHFRLFAARSRDDL